MERQSDFAVRSKVAPGEPGRSGGNDPRETILQRQLLRVTGCDGGTEIGILDEPTHSIHFKKIHDPRFSSLSGFLETEGHLKPGWSGQDRRSADVTKESKGFCPNRRCGSCVLRTFSSLFMSAAWCKELLDFLNPFKIV